MNAEEHPYFVAFRHALTAMEAKNDGERSGFST